MSSAIPRKKACGQCSTAKARCDQKRPRCTRCETRNFRCNYALPTSQKAPNTTTGGFPSSVEALGGFTFIDPAEASTSLSAQATSIGESNNASFFGTNVASPDALLTPESHGSGRSPRGGDQRSQDRTSDTPTFTDLSLICTIDSSRVRNRWMEAFVPSPNQRPKNFPPSIIQFISRVFETYPRMMLHPGNPPPIIHPSQLAVPDLPTPLANCLSLVRMWEGQVRGSEVIVRETVEKEMKRLYEEEVIPSLQEYKCPR